jgi:hypothetical protein
VDEIARRLGFVGIVEYRHAYSRSGGAQFGLGATAKDDLLIVYTEAFDRDADPDDFSLEAIIAHERGHQLVARHPVLSRLLHGYINAIDREVLASLVGALICQDANDHDTLVAKAVAEVPNADRDPTRTWQLVQDIMDTLRKLL